MHLCIYAVWIDVNLINDIQTLLSINSMKYFYCIFAGKNARQVEFLTSKSGERILIIDQYRYFKNSEDKILIKWKCHEYFKSNCPASVATTKEQHPRVVVMNDVHIHTRKKPNKTR